MKIRILLPWLILLLMTSCGDTSEGGGTSVSNPPTLPTASYVPEFDDNIFETSLTTESDSDISTAWLTEENAAFLDGPAAEWDALVLNGPMARARNLRNTVKIWGDRLATRAGNFTLGTTARAFTLQDVRLIDAVKDWRVELSVRMSHIKAVIRDADTLLIQGYYLLTTDDNGEPERGQFFYVNPDTLGPDAETGVRFFALGFDFSDPSSNRLSLTSDFYDEDLHLFIVTHLSYQCDETSLDCVAELVRITSAPPERSFGTSVRLSWNDTSHEICLAEIVYSDTAELGETQHFTGPGVPSDSDVESGACEMASAYWTDRVRSPDDLPPRFNDDSGDGYAAEIYQNGSSETPWEDRITPDTLEQLLMGRF